MARAFRILFVCTGNVCRSPMAEAMLRQRLRENLGPHAAAAFDVSSAGTGALTGAPMESDAISALAAVGVSLEQFSARDLTERLVANADLVLTATRQHRAGVVTTAPYAIRRTFTIREFARLVAAIPPEPPEDDLGARARALVERVAAHRASTASVGPAADDLVDPYRGPARLFVQTAATLEPCVAEIAAALAPSQS